MATGDEVQRAVCLGELPDTLPAGFTRLYFGAEFCPWSFPSGGLLNAALDRARAADWSFTLVTPVISEPFLPLLRERLTGILPRFEEEDEVVISDWGGAELVRELNPDVSVVLGRVLSGQKRGPRICEMGLSKAQLEYFRRGSWYAEEALEALREAGIARIELDNLLQGVAALPEGLHGSLHYPYAMVASTRNCPFREPPDRGQPCDVACKEIFRLETEQSATPLLQRGNTQFLHNPRIPDQPARLGIDRLVFHPDPPR